jgi:hypothetical protein
MMGFLRKTILIGSGGLAPIKANSKKERTAKAAAYPEGTAPNPEADGSTAAVRGHADPAGAD